MYDPDSTYILPRNVPPANPEEAVKQLSPEEREQRIAQKQLMVSLKFHHRELLKKLPLEMSLEAIAEVWYSLQPDD
ncbi:hypothetical protein L3556_11880 [Candidatus Synechococcus calcipolaris G9]|uniref:Uncharacterized protein n=1 Tax=Candidatus Synechococcus calcipolaris G9 TaxID=1497997 RepID=A0ABT6F1C9_9SYNE|nr:hypothetical protein [Candidatus Synechococcus calcipolaris]MDG2991625.1 hypothetical protein [Candidatus Synechococcus calcipolaris G9]